MTDYATPDSTMLVGSQPFAQAPSPNMLLTVFDGSKKELEINLGQFRKDELSFGRAEDNDIVVPSAGKVVSRHHGFLRRVNGVWHVFDNNSTNGVKVNGIRCRYSPLSPGDICSIGRLDSPDDCTIMALGYSDMRWSNVALQRGGTVSIGRAQDNTLRLSSPMVSGHHAAIVGDAQGRFFVQDLNSYNGTYVMGTPVTSPRQLMPGDIVSLALSTIVFTGASLLYSEASRGVDVVADDLVQIRKTRRGKRVTNDHISLHIKRGDFVAIIGGSGSGKSTLLNCLNGSDPAAQGSVYIDGIDLYPNYSYLKNAIGYVPQQDIVYDNLTLLDMLGYAAELRMPPDSTKEERKQRALEVIDLLELSHEKDTFIGQLSGGQKKRASIAVELLADPRLLFLDEPTSGLDPGIEQDLMRKLAAMARDGRTIILVTHTTLNLHLCSQVVFLAPGGKLCYAGPPEGALAFFGVDDFVPIYDMISQEPDAWAARFAASRTVDDAGHAGSSTETIAPKKSPSFASQLSTLSRRYLKLVINDKQRLLLLLLQAPALAALICLVAGADCFKVCEPTQSCLFALSCAAFWVGVLNSIQEICKEHVITKREYAGGLKISAYVLSKVIVLGLLCVVQSLMLTGVFCAMEGYPDTEPLFFHPAFELFVTMLLLTLSAMCLGLWVSALFSNPDRAIAMAPILIMPQVLFSGLIFKLEGVAETISVFVNCRWGMEAFGATADLNALPLSIYGEEVTVPASTQHVDSAVVPVPETTTEYMGQQITIEAEERTVENFDVDVPEQVRAIDQDMYPHEVDHAYDHLLPHLLADWGVLVVFCIVCVGLCAATLRRTIAR